MGYIMEKLKEKNKWFYIVDWIINIALIISFIYLSFVVAKSIKEYCSLPRSFINVTQIIESGVGMNESIRPPV